MPPSRTIDRATGSSPTHQRPLRIERQAHAERSDGTPLFYQVTGATSGQPVVLSDGIGCDGYVWKYLERELGRTHLLVHWNYPGHGRTPLPRDPDRVTVADLADDLVTVAEAALGGSDAARGLVLAGHSMGVQVCLEAYRRHKERVRALILLCGSYGTPLRTFKGQRTLEQVLPFVQFAVNRLPHVAGSVARVLLPTELAFQVAKRFEINGALIRREDFVPYLEHMARVDLRMFLAMLAAAGRHSARDVLHEVAVPTLIIAGDRDGFTPMSLSEEMHAAIRGSELHVVHGGSHTAPIERPAEVCARIETFLGALA